MKKQGTGNRLQGTDQRRGQRAHYSLFPSSLLKGAGVKAQRFPKMCCHELPTVPAGIKMKFVRNPALLEKLVESLCAGIEAIVVLLAAVKIDSETAQHRGPQQALRLLGW